MHEGRPIQGLRSYELGLYSKDVGIVRVPAKTNGIDNDVCVAGLILNCAQWVRGQFPCTKVWFEARLRLITLSAYTRNGLDLEGFARKGGYGPNKGDPGSTNRTSANKLFIHRWKGISHGGMWNHGHTEELY